MSKHLGAGPIWAVAVLVLSMGCTSLAPDEKPGGKAKNVSDSGVGSTRDGGAAGASARSGSGSGGSGATTAGAGGAAGGSGASGAAGENGSSGMGGGGSGGEGGTSGSGGNGGGGSSGGGSGAGGGGGGTGGSNAAPTLTLDFPPAGLTSLGVIHARGSVTDPDGDPIDTLTIHGVTANVSGSSWSAEVTLDVGDNDFTLQATDARGAVGSGPAIHVRGVGAQLITPSFFAYDSAGRRAFVIDQVPVGNSTAYVLYAIDLSSSALTLVSSMQRGSGPAMTQVADVAFDATSSSVYVLESNPATLLRIDVGSGDRSVVSDASTPASGGGTAFQTPGGMALDAAGHRMLVSDTGANDLFAVDLASGVRSVLSSSANGEAIYNPMLIAYDAADQLVFGIQTGGYPVMRIRLSDGMRTRIADLNDNHGVATGTLEGIAFDDAKHRLLLRQFATVIDLDLQSSTRHLIADASLANPLFNGFNLIGFALDPASSSALTFVLQTQELVSIGLTLDPTLHDVSTALQGSGPAVETRGMVVEGGGTTVIATDPWNDQLVRIDLTTGDRSVLSSSTVGTGQAFNYGTSVALDSPNHRAYVLDGFTLLAVDLTNGNRSVVSTTINTPVGTGPDIGYPEALSEYVDTNNHRVVAVSGPSLLEIDLTNGNRTELSGSGRGTGHLPPTQFRDIAYDYAGQRYLVIGDDDQVLAIDPTSGNRTIVSGSMAGSSGPSLMNPTSIDVDTQSNAAIVVDYMTGALVTIDLDTGNRRVTQTVSMLPFDIVVGAQGRRAILALQDSLASVDLAARASQALYTPPERNSLGFDGSIGPLAMNDLASGHAYAFSPSGVVDFDLGDGSSNSKADSGSVSYRGLLFETFFDPASHMLYGCTGSSSSGAVATVFSADVTNPMRAVVSATGTGSGPTMAGPTQGAVDAAGNRLIVLDAGLQAVLGIDIATGNRVNLSGGPVGNGTAFNLPLYMAYDAPANRVLVVDGNTLFSADLSNGNRTELSGGSSNAGTGPTLTTPKGIILDRMHNRAIVRETTLMEYLAIDLDHGDRSVLIPDLAAGPAALAFTFSQYELDYDPARRVIFAGDYQHPQRALLAVDELTGDFVAVLGRTP